ncbi:hypothetical protein KC19_9G089500 [Ceratodon purpureus]|uniref:Uncharacterized protein n=1 Tax=Ceratodon purpureus TaxID=3225 RepID=A0A8T0GTR6_CERPU|nr:hypothetical protein KC19_9G089500 [Ceratodon purpureus]
MPALGSSLSGFLVSWIEGEVVLVLVRCLGDERWHEGRLAMVMYVGEMELGRAGDVHMLVR